MVLSTSVSGSTIAVMCALALLLQFQPWRQTIFKGISTNATISNVPRLKDGLKSFVL